MTEVSISSSAGWNFDNSYAGLPDLFYSRVEPVPVREPRAVILNEELARELGLDPEWLRGEEAAAIFAGNAVPEGSEPLAQAYAGHQFGGFNRLGDGRAVLLGEQIAPAGGRFDIQLKGSGRTPYSRGGDGRAALGPMLREYIISEAMHALGIPTTRSLAVVTTGEPVRRETDLRGAVLTRVAASHLRVGTFQYAAQWGGPDAVRTLADYAIRRHYPDIAPDAEDRYLRLLEGVLERQASLVSQWMLAGFIHGVLNTDNVAIGGESIDYGPCAFMDAYDPSTVFSSIDTGGRYAYGNQPYITLWNVTRLAETLVPLLHEEQERAVELAQTMLDRFERLYLDHWLAGMRAKLGLSGAEPEDEQLIGDLLDLMKAFRADYTNTFVGLTFDAPVGEADQAGGEAAVEAQAGEDRAAAAPSIADDAGNAELDYAGVREAGAGSGPDAAKAGAASGGELSAAGIGAEEAARPASFPGADALLGSGEYRAWRERWQARLGRRSDSASAAFERMRRHNPAVIPRNHRVEEALAAAVNADDYGPLRRLVDALSRPYAHAADQAEYAQLPPQEGGGYVTYCGT
ncbi:YdiU family protein [Saccharibacillus sp. CPCC 101409]|uniref:protein adenylyltransferase SelO n=1 Tax=Saccharibacillus sp. CPCC 101409 TaxID=3058041 RepID=UPI00267114FF|nr:YdiU family protein [Saccharibacillus sp. CPCC 101409]MDO3409829.1 YdiU family protein [Saccharibacillus sp. CPCC 101409]